MNFLSQYIQLDLLDLINAYTYCIGYVSSRIFFRLPTFFLVHGPGHLFFGHVRVAGRHLLNGTLGTIMVGE